ncbi:MAG: GGDEF domain-containing protein [Lachnospiraceae bacterium]|nr:GGDEF domain-containing protein [Lachnospiraceae bacterium]
MIQHLIHVNYATILIIALLITFVFSNKTFTKRINNLFINSIFCVLILIIADSIETWTASFDNPTTLRIIVSAIGYSFRPFCILNIILIVIRSTKINYRLLYFPTILNLFISFSSLFTDLAFSYSSDNQFVRGPLGYTAYCVCIFYLLTLIIITILYLRERHIYETFVIFIMFFIASLSLILEVIYMFDGFINATFAVSITFYYLLFHTQTAKKDPLTHAFNRRCFYEDASHNFSRIKGIISIDLNDLKKLNDNTGHACGDIALCTIVSVIKKTLPLGCTLYRTGGDEFMILCMKYNQNELEEIITKMRLAIANTPYTCAFGLAMQSNNDSLDSLCAKADAIMYEDKIRIKGVVR